MNSLLDARLFSGLLMIAFPLALAVYLTRRFSLGWRLWWIGAATFILSQVGHIPFNALLTLLFQRGILPNPPPSWNPAFNAVILGLSAGLWEELSRAGVYRWWATDARSWRKGVLLGAGHGGIEAIILGGIVLMTFGSMLAMRGVDLSTMVPPEQLDLARQQVAAYWSLPWQMGILGFVERLFTIPFHIALSVVVMQAFTRRQPAWIALAVLWHAFADALVVYLAGIWSGQTWSPYALEGVIAVNMLASLVVLFALRRPEPPEPQAEVISVPPAGPVPAEAVQIEVTEEKLDDSRFSE